ncbi:MAG: hypothetical protein ACRBB3_02505 [Alphaproteobacteria bacterium]
MSLKNKFHDQKTGITYPKMAWNKANARLDAEERAAIYLYKHKGELRKSGISHAAAAMYVTKDRDIKFSIYDRTSQSPNDVTPSGAQPLRPVDPYLA